MKWLGSRVMAALDDWQGALMIGASGALISLLFDTPRSAFLYGLAVGLGWMLLNILFGPIQRPGRRDT
jgi:hypothetical protein